MLFNLLDLDVDYGSETIDTEQYGAYVQMEALLLVRELMHICEKLEKEIFMLREQVNELCSDEDPCLNDDCPYPNPYACPWESVYVGWLLGEVYAEPMHTPQQDTLRFNFAGHFVL
jgi:hypothetical protein